jgi:hypothetical protein
LDFITSLLLLVGPVVVPPVPLRENIFLLCVCRRMRCRSVRTLHKALARPFRTKMCRKRGRALFFFRSRQSETIFFCLGFQTLF